MSENEIFWLRSVLNVIRLYYYGTSSWIVFVRFLGELKIPKRLFEVTVASEDITAAFADIMATSKSKLVQKMRKNRDQKKIAIGMQSIFL